MRSLEKRSSSYTELQEQHRSLLSQVSDYKSSVREIKASASEALEGSSLFVRLSMSHLTFTPANKALLQGEGLVATIRDYKAAVGQLQGQLESCTFSRLLERPF